MEKKQTFQSEEENKYEFVEYIGLPYVISKLLCCGEMDEDE